MADTFVRDYGAAVREVIRAGLLIVLIRANDMIIEIIRLDTGELRASVVSNWAEGRDGGSHRPPANLKHYPVPDNSVAMRVAAAHVPGNSVSTTSLVIQGFWVEHDGTFEQVAAMLNSLGVIEA